MKRWMMVLGACLAFAAPAQAGVLSPNNVLGMQQGPLRGWVMVIHGGGWMGGASLMGPDLAFAHWLNVHGYGTYTIDYRSGQDSYWDSLTALNWLRSKLAHVYGSNQPPLCLEGESAGGHLALMLAGTSPVGINCVISQAGPTDLMTFPNEPAGGSTTEPKLVYTDEVVPTWGPTYKLWSPVTWCPMPERILMAASTGDQIVPQQQMADFKAACPNATTMLLDGDPADGPLTGFTHAGITQAAASEWNTARLAFLP